MKILRTIRDIDVGWNYADQSVYKQERRAARAIVFDTDNNLALLHATNKGYHKLPGGGIEEGEDIIQALRREILEEIGCKIVNLKELGIVEEYRNKFSLHQLSYCFIVDILGENGMPQLEKDEIKDGFKTVWLSIDEAIKILENERGIEHYEGRFILERDLFLLIEAKKLSKL